MRRLALGTRVAPTAPLPGTEDGNLDPAIAQLFLHRFKPYLNAALPFRSPQTQTWEPQIRQSETQTVSLVWLPETLAALLATLKPRSPRLVGRAAGLSPKQFEQAMAQLTGVVMNHPVGASEAYRFNLREAVLAAELVSHPAQIYFLEEAIATLLPALHTPASPAIQPQVILVVSAGTSTTELALAQCPVDAHKLSRREIALSRLAYAGNALDQDIICQLLYPTATGWQDLSLHTLDLPLPGEPDLKARYQLQQRLEGSSIGRSLLQAVRQIKPTLCQQDVEFVFQGQQWNLSYRELQRWILVPYLQQLNREVNLLLTQLDLTPDAVQTVMCVGGTAAIAAVERGLQRKFPQALIVSPGSATTADPTNEIGVARGLSLLPYFPEVLDAVRHQFSEYYLLRTTLKTLPVQAEPISEAHIQYLLEAQGIPPAVSQPFIATLLEGQLPAGLVPTRASSILLAPKSIQSVEYRELSIAPLLSLQGNQIYRLNRQQRDRLWNQLQIILANTHQTLMEPLAIAWVTA